MVIAFLLIVQPVYSLDAFLLNGATIITMIALSIFAKVQFNIESFIYYILIVAGFILLSRLFISILFYAEVQKYKQESISNSLLDTVMFDELTHCKNRYALKKYLEYKVPQWKVNKTTLLIVMFDIDNFKEYNDYFSHQVGDGCLKGIAGAVKSCFPSPGLEFYRYGGEEFLLFFELENPDEAPRYIEEVRSAIVGLDIVAPKGAPKKVVTVSIGGLLLQNIESFSFEEEMSLVDSYLYKAKASGKDVACYNGNIIY